MSASIPPNPDLPDRPRWRRWPIANVVTAARGLSGPVVAAALLYDPPWNFAFFWFIFAALTDLIDGWLAKQTTGPTLVGQILDPLADKLLFACGWMAAAWVGYAPLWLAVLHTGRGVVVGLFAVRRLLADLPPVPNRWGQVEVCFEATGLAILMFHGPWELIHWPTVGLVTACIAIPFSAASVYGQLTAYARAGSPEPR